MNYKMSNDEFRTCVKIFQDNAKRSFDVSVDFKLQGNSEVAEYFEGQHKAYQDSIKVLLTFATKTEKI